MDKDTKKSIKRSTKLYDTLIERTKVLAERNPNYDMSNFIEYLQGKRDYIASQIGKPTGGKTKKKK